jgi:AcrR family transcriptional regulator
MAVMDTTPEQAEKLSTRVRHAPGSSLMRGSVSAMVKQARKSTQQSRLLRGMVNATNRHGYGGASVALVAEEAGVSKPTFYDYFKDRDDCFVAAINEVQERILAHVDEALASTGGPAPMTTMVKGLASFAATDPGAARFLMSEAPAGGASALDARDAGIRSLAERVEEAGEGAVAAEEPAPDLPAIVVVATAYRLMAARLRRAEGVSSLASELPGWLAAYARPAGERRWGELVLTPAPRRSPYVPDVPIQETPGRLPPGRSRLTDEEIAENHRLRVLYTVAKLAADKGYAGTTVADITRQAGIDGRNFYRLYADKQEAFAAVHELGFQHVMDVTAKAFFSTDGWPQRSWEAGRALTQLLDANPMVAHVGFIEAYAVGPSAVQRLEDSVTAFIFFLQEGLILADPDSAPTRIGMEAIIASVFEVIYLRVREESEPQIAAALATIVHLWLTPFLGAKASDEFIDGQLARERRAKGARRKPKAS